MIEQIVPLLESLPGPDEDARAAVNERAAQVLRPAGALKRLDDVAVWLAGWQRSARPEVRSPAAVVFVADHGVTVERVSAYPAEVTSSMLDALRDGVATASVAARALGIGLSVVDVGVGRPTEDLAQRPALTSERFEECWNAGRAAVAGLNADLLVLGEMGIGNTTAAAAVAHALFGCRADDWTGRGTGIDDETLARKIAVVETAVRRLPDHAGPFEVLRQVGGGEIVAVAAAALEARRRSIPIVLDGFVVTAAVAALEAARAGALDHCIAGHCSPEPGHRLLLDKLGKEPLLELGLRLGEGSGALFAVPLVRIAADSVVKVATFSEWGLE